MQAINQSMPRVGHGGGAVGDQVAQQEMAGQREAVDDVGPRRRATIANETRQWQQTAKY